MKALSKSQIDSMLADLANTLAPCPKAAEAAPAPVAREPFSKRPEGRARRAERVFVRDGKRAWLNS